MQRSLILLFLTIMLLFNVSSIAKSIESNRWSSSTNFPINLFFHSLDLEKNSKKELANLMGSPANDHLILSIKTQSHLIDAKKDGYSYESLVIKKNSYNLRNYGMNYSYAPTMQSGGGLFRDIIIGTLIFGVGGWGIDKLSGGDTGFGTWCAVGAGIGLVFHFVK